jgi:aerobic carbon-monoxide dehydrogenase medium subunit
MKPAPFDYHAPTTLNEAVGLMGGLEDAKVLAGGQSLIPILAMRLSRFEHLVDLGRVGELVGIDRVNGTVTVGAMTTDATVGASDVIATGVPLLAKATPLIGHFQIRNRGTLGGSIAHADPAAEYPAVAVALDATIEIAGPSGSRRVAASEFFEATFMTDLAEGEILTAVHFPVWEGPCGFAAEEVARRHGDFALVGVVAGVQLDGGTVAKAGVALFGVGGRPHRAASVEAALVGAAAVGADLAGIGRLVVDDLDPPGDIHASAAYRREIAGVLVERALGTAIREASSRG